MRISFLEPGLEQGPKQDERWQACRELLAIEADMAVLPELFFAGHAMPPVPSDGSLPTALRAICADQGRALLFGYEEACSGEVFNAVQLIDHRGAAIANYRCAHPGQAHHGIGRWLTIVPFAGHHVGLLAGDDLLAPEVWRSLALSGATCILWTTGAHADSAWMLRARARENGIAVVGADAAGVHAFDAHGAPIAVHAQPGVVHLALGPPAALGPPIRRQPVLYRRLVADAAQVPL